MDQAGIHFWLGRWHKWWLWAKRICYKERCIDWDRINNKKLKIIVTNSTKDKMFIYKDLQRNVFTCYRSKIHKKPHDKCKAWWRNVWKHWPLIWIGWMKRCWNNCKIAATPQIFTLERINQFTQILWLPRGNNR